MHSVTGSTRLYGLVGDPLTAARSPQLFNQLFASQGVDAVCIPMLVPAADLTEFVRGARAMRNLAGLLVTMPHKQRMLEFIDEQHPTSRQVGAVNVIRCDEDGSWVGAIFDGVGCVQAMRWAGNDPANKSVLLIGAGGAGTAIAFAVAQAGARALRVSDIDAGRAQSLARAVQGETGCIAVAGSADPRKFEVVINATSMGMKSGDALPVDIEGIERGSIVVDIVNSTEPTPLYRAASARGCRVQDGRPMHRGQAVHALRFLGFEYVPETRLEPSADQLKPKSQLDVTSD